MAAELQRFRREGFPGQRLRVVPRSILRTALEAPVTSQLVVTDCGYFPRASDHGRARPHGAGQAILVICSRGRGWAETGGTRHRIGPRQALVLPRRQPHSYGADPEDPWTIWWVHLDGAQVPDLLRATGVSPQRPVLAVAALARCTALVAEIIDHLEGDESLASLRAASGAAWHLVTGLTEPRAGVRADDPVERIRERLAEDLAGPLSVDELAAVVSLSPSHLTALFRKHTGYAPMRYRTLLRMQRARELLDTSDKPIAVIAREIGYDDVAYFSRRFRSLHEVGPRAYRRAAKG